MKNISFKVSGSYPPFGIELRQNNITGSVIRNIVVDTIGEYEFTDVEDGQYVIVIYDTVGGRINSEILTVVTTTTTTTTTTVLETLDLVIGGNANTTIDSLFLKSQDNGVTWDIDQKNNGEPITSIGFFDENIGISVGGSGYVWRTTNGGNNWDLVGSPSNKINEDVNGTLDFVEIIDSDIALIGGSGNGTNNQIFKTINAGLTFTKLSGSLNGSIETLFSYNENRIIVSVDGGIGNDSLKISTNGGITYSNISNVGGLGLIKSIDFNSIGIGYAGGYNTVLWKTINYGDSWIDVSYDLFLLIGGTVNIIDLKYGGDSILFVFALDSNNNPVLCYYDLNNLTWINISNNINNAKTSSSLAEPTSMEWLDENNGWLLFSSDSSGSNTGEILRTTNGGQTWTSSTNNLNNNVKRVIKSVPTIGLSQTNIPT